MQMFKRTLSIVLTVVMLVSMFSMVTFASAAWDGTVATEFESGSGTEANPYIIVNAEQLALMSTNIAAGTDAGAYYKLGADITLNEGVLDADYNLNSGTFTSWTSGGTFSGVFDGDGHTIYGFYSTQQNGGLFSTVKGTIKNLKMKDAAYKLTWTVFGILASKVSGATIENVEVDGAIIGNQTGNDQQSRGIMVGRGSANFIGCIVRGKVVSTNVATVQRCGGFIGVADSTTNFTNCVNYADLGDLSQVGGFAGLSTGAINFTDCINYGNITSSTAYASYLGNNAEGHSSAAGGFVGVVYKGHPNFTRCANEGTIIGDSYAGGLIGVALNYYHTITLNNIYNIGAISAMGTNGLEYADDFIGHIYNGVANKTSVEAGNLADYQAGAWLGEGADLWVVKSGTNPTLKLVAGDEPEAPHEHAYTAETTPATCTEAGKTVYTCECGDTYEEVIPATGHTYVDGKCECGEADPDYVVESGFADGSGTEVNPYIIVNADQLALMSEKIADGTGADAYYKLGADITLNENVLDADYNLNSGTFTSWTSGGTFSGVFDGDGHTIYGFYSTQQNGGLFSTVKGTIKNLKMKDAAYKLTWTVFGILASKVSGATIENVEVDGAIIGNQTGNDQQSRGIMVGRGSANFIGCIVRGKVVSTNVATVQRCGGFIGVADSTTNFTNCVNYADLGDLSQVGGFAGLSTGAINFTDCINYGNITSSTAYASYLGNNAEGHSSAAGGFVGVVYKGHPNFTRCANEGTIIGDSYAGGLIGVALNYYHTITLNNIYNIGAISAMGTNGLEYADDFIGYIYSGVANKTSVEAGNLADYQAGAWLGEGADLWVVKSGTNPTLKLVAGDEPEAPHEHAYTAETTPATCTEAGKTVYTCECGDSYEEVIPAKGHTEVTETVDATCTVDGATIVKCSVCGTTISATVIPATGHTYVDGVCKCGEIDAECTIQVGDKYYKTFAEAYAAAEAGDTITLLADITADAIITIDKAITLDGNGKTLTSTAGRAINVDCAGAVTIEDLTIVAKGERAINIINQPANVTVNNVTATAKNYAIMMATSAAGADLVVNDSDLTGLAVINVASADSIVEINDTKITNVDANPNENYGAITVFSTATNATITVNGGEINVADDSKKAYIFADSATVIGVDEIGCIVAMIGDAGYESLASAIADAKAGQTVKLVADIEVDAIITIDKAITLDGNGKTLTSTAGRAINVECTGDVTIENLTIVAKGERAINIINEPANVTVNNVTATAANYAVNLATSATGANVTINDSDLTGLAVVNVAAADSIVEINDTKITNVDANPNENYGAITVYHAAENATVNVNGGEIIVADDSRKAYVFADSATVNGIDDVGMIAARIGDAGYETLEEALADAKAGDTITVIQTAVIDEDMTIANVKIVAGSKADPAIRIVNGATVTFENVTIDAAEYCVTLGASDFSSAGNLIIKSGSYHGNITAISVTNGNLVIEGGSFSADPYNGNYAYLINCIDSSYANRTATVAIRGGKFENWNPQDNAAEGAGSNFCAAGYEAVENEDGTFGVIVHVHAYVDGVCKCGEADPDYLETLAIQGFNVKFESDYSLYVYVPKTITDQYATVKVIASKAMYEGDTFVGYSDVELTEGISQGNYMLYEYAGFAAKEIASEIKAHIVAIDADGNEFYGPEKNYSLQSYALNQIKKSTTAAKFRTMMVDFVNYGAAAQVYFSYNTTALANVGAEDYQNLATPTRAYEKHTANTADTSYATQIKGFNLQFLNKVHIYGYVAINGQNIEDIKANWYGEATYVDADGKSQTQRIDLSDMFANSGYYLFSFNNLFSKEMSIPVTFTLYNAEGEQMSNAATYSIESYANSKGSGTDNLAKLTQALMSFGDAASAYFAK